MTQPLICHFLIGLPASGKSTFARKLQEIISNAAIVSTDTARKELFKKETQGDWATEVEPKVLEQIKKAIASNKLVIYDATNVRRDWRMGMLMKIEAKLKEIDTLPVYWVAWHLQTSVDLCKEWNQKRDRNVPDGVIERYAEYLYQFSPHKAEGFVQIVKVFVDSKLSYKTKVENKTIDIRQVLDQNNNFGQQQKQNRKSNFIWHQYSKLLDFERLMHLISTIIRYPNIGNLSQDNPEALKKALRREKLPIFNNSASEIAAVIEKEYGSLYADRQSIQTNLVWLKKNGLIGKKDYRAEIEIDTLQESEVSLEQELFSHRYSDLDNFVRLIKLIRFIFYHPFLNVNGKTAEIKAIIGNETNKVRCTALVNGAIDREIISIPSDDLYQRKAVENIVREDIRQLSPYRIIHDPFNTKAYTKNFSKIFAMNYGYFIGTGIFSQEELNKLYNLLRSQFKEEYFHDPSPENQRLYQTFEQRMKNSKLWQKSPPYPVKVIGSKSIVNFDEGVNLTVFEEFDRAIRNNRLINLEVLRQPWDAPQKAHYLIKVYPLQIVFHLFAWYLGYEVAEGNNKGLFYFERIDRLRIDKSQNLGERSSKVQIQSLEKLNCLYQASAGIYLGKSAEDQKAYLNSKTKKSVETIVKIYATEASFDFLGETAHRFPENQMKMSTPKWLEGKLRKEKVYKFKQQKNHYPHVYKIEITLPKWSVDDIYLIKWLVPWGKEVKVTEPKELVDKIRQRGNEIYELYKDI